MQDPKLKVMDNVLLLDSSVRPIGYQNKLGQMAHLLLFYLTGKQAKPTSRSACVAEDDKDFPKHTYKWIRGAGEMCFADCFVTKLILDAIVVWNSVVRR